MSLKSFVPNIPAGTTDRQPLVIEPSRVGAYITWNQSGVDNASFDTRVAIPVTEQNWALVLDVVSSQMHRLIFVH